MQQSTMALAVRRALGPGILLLLAWPSLAAQDPDPKPGSPPREEAALVPPLKEGETLHSESFDIDPAGRFTYKRSVRRQAGFLGAEVRLLDREAAGRLHLTPFEGVLVISVERGGPAALAGLARDDVIVTFDGEPIRSLEQFSFLVEEIAPGAPVKVELLRDGSRHDLQVTLGGQSRITASRSVIRTLPAVDDRGRTGLRLVEMPPELAPLVGSPAASGGLLVADILAGGPAFFTPARRKDLLVEAGGRPVRTAAEYREAAGGLAPGAPLTLVLDRRGERIEARLCIAKDATRERQFHLPLHLVSYEDRASKSKFSLLWGVLFHTETSHKIRSGHRCEDHHTRREMGVALNLFRYRSCQHQSETRLLWFLPFRFGRESCE